MVEASRLDGARDWQVVYELIFTARTAVLVAIAAAFGRAISEVGASLMVGGNILNIIRVLTTWITLETSKEDFDNSRRLLSGNEPQSVAHKDDSYECYAH
jgi:tungstate transport system permease protein